MAIVFVSPKQRQKMFFMGIAGTLVVFLIIVTLLVFLSKPKMVSTTQVFQKPEISIDFAVLDAEQVKNSDILNKLQLSFSYQARTNLGQNTEGKILAPSLEEAQKLLEEQGLSDIQLKEPEVGRENPFSVYYSQ